MQDFIVALCLGAAGAYLVRLIVQKIRRRGSGCCGCGKQGCCSKKPV